MYTQIQELPLNISFDKLSAKQLICQCLDLITNALRQLVKEYQKSTNVSTSIDINKSDLNKIINYVVENTMLECLTDFVKVHDANQKYYIKNLLFELKNIRNIWAHNPNLQQKLVLRAFDTTQMLLSKLNINKDAELYKKIHTYKKLLIIKLAQQYARQLEESAMH